MAYEIVKRHGKNYIKSPVDGINDCLLISHRVGKYEYTTGEVIDRLAELEDMIERGQAVILPTGAIDVLKLLTCASICYQHIYENMVEDMAKSEDIGKLFMKSPMPQGTTLRTALYELMQSDISCNKITGIDDILNAMPSFKEYLKKPQKQS